VPPADVSGRALVLTGGHFATSDAKTAHGLVRGSERFEIAGIVDAASAGKDAGEVLDGKARGIPVFASLPDAFARLPQRPEWGIVGIAVAGGRMPDWLRAALREAIGAGLSIVNGLHEYVSEDPELSEAARRSGVRVVDVRRPKTFSQLRFWSGEITGVKIPRLAVLGTDCALGKRTTARMLRDACRAAGVATELLFTGQTGWMQGCRFGFILDSTLNDFVSGELEGALLDCARETAPDLMILEGQSALRNPSGPCGSELLLSGAARGVVLQHAPAREFFEGLEEPGCRIPDIAGEIELIRMYGARTIAIALNTEHLTGEESAAAQVRLSERLSIPVVRPLEEGVAALVPVVRDYLLRESLTA
jgi:uncharacterized NAD-dependent epimerase/dehydratase family protein